MNDDTSNHVVIPLSKTGKHAGKYTAFVSPEDADLAEYNWCVRAYYKNSKTEYAYRNKSRSQGNNRIVYIHRVIIERILGRPPVKGEEVDHIDGNGLNNTRDNLRIVDRTKNQMNIKLRTDNKSGYKGVSLRKANQKWIATIKVNRKQIYLGQFDTPEEAHAAYCEAANKYFEDYANHG